MPAYASIELLKATPLTAHTGSSISGLDLSQPLAPAQAAALLRELDTRGIVLIRGQRLTAEQFVTFGRGLGELAEYPLHNYSPPGLPALLICSNIIENGLAIGYDDAGRRWRMEGAQIKHPTRATLQYAAEVPHKDGVPMGDTLFASTSRAYAALEPALSQQLQGMRAVVLNDVNRRRRSMPHYADAGLSQIFQKGVEHPVVRTHPQTRQKCLYVSEGGTARICGMNPRDSDALLGELYQHMARPEFVYRHAWQAGDVLLWDNSSIQHRTLGDFQLPLRRVHYRAQLKNKPGDALHLGT